MCERGRTKACVPQLMAGPPQHARHTAPRLALNELGHGAPGYSCVATIGDWTSTRRHDVAGSTEARTSACDVLVQRVGVCRDSAQLAMALCRALCIPARSVSSDAVGLTPSDFHGFFEAYLGARWYVCDATRRAPMDGLVRIGTGRDTPAIATASRRRSMPELTPEGQQHVTELAQRYGVSVDAVMTLLHALVQGHGTMAQFDHRELGGRGQWMAGGMVMVGDMWNNALKTTVDGLCTALSRLVTPEVVQAQPASSPRQSQRGPHQQRGDVSPPDSGRTPAAVSVFVPSSVGGSEEAWWPADLGAPTTSGSQQTMRYAYLG